MLADAPAAAAPIAMPRDDHQHQSCGRHQKFATEDEAWRHFLARVVANACDPGQSTFFCRACGWWHHGGAPFKSLSRFMAENGLTDEFTH